MNCTLIYVRVCVKNLIHSLSSFWCIMSTIHNAYINICNYRPIHQATIILNFLHFHPVTPTPKSRQLQSNYLNFFPLAPIPSCNPKSVILFTPFSISTLTIPYHNIYHHSHPSTLVSFSTTTIPSEIPAIPIAILLPTLPSQLSPFPTKLPIFPFCNLHCHPTCHIYCTVKWDKYQTWK